MLSGTLFYFISNYEFRGIAQSGSAPALGAGCREFESLYPDQIIFISQHHAGFFLCTWMYCMLTMQERLSVYEEMYFMLAMQKNCQYMRGFYSRLAAQRPCSVIEFNSRNSISSHQLLYQSNFIIGQRSLQTIQILLHMLCITGSCQDNHPHF